MCARRASGGNSSDFDLTRLSAVRYQYGVTVYCVQSELAAMRSSRPAYCTQQTGGLRWEITSRAIQASDADRPGKRGAVRPTPPHNIACNTLPCSFTRIGLATLIARVIGRSRRIGCASQPRCDYSAAIASTMRPEARPSP